MNIDDVKKLLKPDQQAELEKVRASRHCGFYPFDDAMTAAEWLYGAFDWMESPQGYTYWRLIYQTLQLDGTTIPDIEEPAEKMPALRVPEQRHFDALELCVRWLRNEGWGGTQADILAELPAILRASQERDAHVREVIADLLQYRIGALPTRGDLRDNDRSRAALGRLFDILESPQATPPQAPAVPDAEPIQKIIMAHCASTMSMERCRNLGNDIAELVAAETDQLRLRVEQFAAGLTTIANRELPTEAWAAHHAKITLDGYHATVEQLLRQRVAELESARDFERLANIFASLRNVAPERLDQTLAELHDDFRRRANATPQPAAVPAAPSLRALLALHIADLRRCSAAAAGSLPETANEFAKAADEIEAALQAEPTAAPVVKVRVDLEGAHFEQQRGLPMGESLLYLAPTSQQVTHSEASWQRGYTSGYNDGVQDGRRTERDALRPANCTPFDELLAQHEADPAKAALLEKARARAAAAPTLLQQLEEILDGIDADNKDRDEGYWETSTGVEFGASVLAQVRLLVNTALPPGQVVIVQNGKVVAGMYGLTDGPQ